MSFQLIIYTNTTSYMYNLGPPSSVGPRRSHLLSLPRAGTAQHKAAAGKSMPRRRRRRRWRSWWCDCEDPFGPVHRKKAAADVVGSSMLLILDYSMISSILLCEMTWKFRLNCLNFTRQRIQSNYAKHPSICMLSIWSVKISSMQLCVPSSAS